MNNPTPLLLSLSLLLSPLGCAPLAGTWSGEVDCGDYAMDVEITLEPAEKGYEGEGVLDCTDGVGFDCEQTFSLDVRPEGGFGEQELDIDLDDCEVEAGGFEGTLGCDNPDDVVWDGRDLIVAEWGDCDAELEHD